MKHRPEIDGLRSFAVVPVLLFHAGFTGFSGGYVGVDVFFVISGFLITSLLLRDIELGRYSIVDFYERRARRILPALFLVMICCVPFAALWMTPPDLKLFGESVFAATTFWSNVLFWIKIDYFHSGAELQPLLHTWSLSVEEQFYIFFPPLLFLLWKAGLRMAVGIIATLSLASLLAAHYLPSMLGHPMVVSGNFYLLPTRAWELGIGALGAFVQRRQMAVGQQPATPGLLSNSLAAAGLLAIVASIFIYDETTPFPSFYALLPTLGTALVLLYARTGTLTYRVLIWKPFVAIGLISYSAYLWHQPLLAFARYRMDGELPLAWAIPLVIVPFLLGYLSWKYVEAPFRDRQRMGRGRILRFSLAGGAVMVAAGAGLWLTNGLYDRYLGTFAEPYRAQVRQLIDTPQDYVPGRFKHAYRRDFADDGRPKVLLVGDSYAKDLMNMLGESGLDQRFDISTDEISARCGNLHLNGEEHAYIDEGYEASCASETWYAAPRTQALMAEADMVWLASSWDIREAGVIADSLANIRADSDSPVLVFGRKNFGNHVSVRAWWHAVVSGDPAYHVALEPFHVEVNEAMAGTLPETDFVNLSEMLCGDAPEQCRNTTPEGMILSFDGGHLTRAGAVHGGALLTEELRRRGLLDDHGASGYGPEFGR